MASFNSYKSSSEPSTDGQWRPADRLAQIGQDQGCLLDRRLTGAGLLVLRDRLAPEHSHKSFDRVVVGAGGVTVVDMKNYTVNVRIDRFGGLLARRHAVLVIEGRDHTPQAIAIRRQIDGIRTILDKAGLHHIEVQGALCSERLPSRSRRGQTRIATVLIGNPDEVAELAGRAGALDAAAQRYIADELDSALRVA